MIRHAYPLPNPSTGAVAPSLELFLAGPADELRWRVYSSALVEVSEGGAEGLAAGWNRVPLPSRALPSASGLYYVEIQARRGGGAWTPSLVAKWFVLR